MNPVKTRIVSIVAAMLSLAASALAQSGGGFDLSWNAMTGGGGSSTGGGFSLDGSITQPSGQPDPVMSGGAFVLSGGFWPVTQTCFCLGDMNSDTRKDALDVQRFTECVVAGGACACADVDAANGVSIADIPAFVTDLMAGNACP